MFFPQRLYFTKKHMYTRFTSYTLVSHPPTEKTLINQQYIKSCMFQEKNLWWNHYVPRILFFVCTVKIHYIN